MDKRTKEQQQQEMERKHQLREKQILQIKAQNEMLEESKKGIINRYGEDSETGKDLLSQIDEAKQQNLDRAKEYLNATPIEIENGIYNKVNPKEEEYYYKRLENLGKSDELLHIKNIDEYNKKVKAISKTKKQSSTAKELSKRLNSLKDKNNMNTVKEGMENVEKTIKEKKSNVIERVSEIKPQKNDIKYDKDLSYPDFDPRDVPSYVQYDIIPLPSKGECYAHKKTHLPVAYLTTSDENLITSRNLYNSGSMIDIILERKILDKSIRVSDLCKGDRDALAIWLRATAYGPNYPVVVNYEGEEIEATIDLNDINYLDFNLKGDENGWFEYTIQNGDVLKYKILSYKEEQELFEKNIHVTELINRHTILTNIDKTSTLIETLNQDEKEEIIETLDVIKEWVNNFDVDKDELQNETYMTYITDRMFMQTMSVNGNTDREYIKVYIENMRAGYAHEYRKHIAEQIPGVNLEVTIPIPESLGGGSFNTFLSIGETIFANV